MKLTVLLKPSYSVISPEQSAEEGDDIQTDMEEIHPGQETDLLDPEAAGMGDDEPDMPTGKIADRYSQRAKQAVGY